LRASIDFRIFFGKKEIWYCIQLHRFPSSLFKRIVLKISALMTKQI